MRKKRPEGGSGLLSQPESLWVHEQTNPVERISWRLDKVIAEGRTVFQQYKIGLNRTLGLTLFIDNIAQAAQPDEFIYHESLVHPFMMMAPEAKRIGIIDGGDGGTLREVHRYKSVISATVVDIDGELVDACRKHLAVIHRHSFDDPRAKIHMADAWDYLRTDRGDYDVIILDITDPIPNSPAERLYGIQFLEIVYRNLNPGGVITSLAGAIKPGKTGDFAGFVIQRTLYSPMFCRSRFLYPLSRNHGDF